MIRKKIIISDNYLMIGWLNFLFIFALLTLLGCTSGKAPKTILEEPQPFTISGQVTYDWVNANDNVTEGGNLLDYAGEAARPARRVVVQALSGSTVITSTSTDDLGNYSLTITGGRAVTIRALAKSAATSNTADATLPNNCSGASWDFRIVDNVTGNSSSSTDPTLRAQYSITDSTVRNATATGVNLHAALTYSGGYTDRSAAPFAILDTLITEIEMVCTGSATLTFPLLYVNWSASNTSTAGSKYLGEITTSHFTTESSQPNIYILGQAEVDTDEYDDHVIAHEFGHYLENQLYRSDSIGGSHSTADSLDIRLAFGEGFGNAISAMTFNDSIYVDTSGAGQASGFEFNVATAPAGDDLGVYSEFSAQHFLWMLYENRDVTANSGSFDRIHNIFKNFQSTTGGFTSLQSFAAYYNQEYGGAAESISTLWGTTLDTPYDSLCIGACTGTVGVDNADVFDSDNDIGPVYASGAAGQRAYKQGSAVYFTSPFWQLYRTLASGANAATDHDQTHLGGYAAGVSTNKFGMNRLYTYVGTGVSTTITVGNLGGGAACTSDLLDMYVYLSGTLITYDISSSGATAGCPTVTFTATNGSTYTINIRGLSSAVSSWDITVAP